MMHFTPVIPAPPSPEGRSPVQPPVVPTFSPESTPAMPAWTRSAAAGPNYATAFPVGQTPYLSVPGMPPGMPPGMAPGMAPGSYFMPSVALPGQMHPGMPPQMATPMTQLRPDGFSTDWTGFPQVVNPNGPSPAASPWHPAGAFGAQPQMPPQAMPPQFAAAYQQGYHPAMAGYAWTPAMSMGSMATPFVQAGGFGPGPGWAGATPFQPAGAFGPPPGAAAAAAAAAAAGGAAPAAQPAGHHRPARTADGLDRFDKWDEEPVYGPVLDAFLVKVVNAKLELNPLLAPPPDRPEDRPYLKWNMLFPTAQCQRSSDPGHRSWAEGRHSPATWPRVKSLRILCRHVPWEMQIKASDPEMGVTCGDVVEGIHEYMYGRVSNQQLENATPAHKRLVGQSYWHNRSTAHGVPGGRLFNTLLRCDWLALNTMFGGIVDADAQLLDDLACGAALPATFELKCLQRYPMTEAEIREHEARESAARLEAEREARRSRSSRGTSRATSRVPSRAPSRARSSQNTTTSDSDEDS